MPEHALHADSLVYRYARTGWQLGPVTLTFGDSMLTGIIGPNGSGKSTLLSILARATEAEGNVTVCGEESSTFTSREWAQQVAYLPQRVIVQYDFSVEETVAFGRYPHTGITGFLTQRDQAVIDRCLEETELHGLRSRLLSELSGGERQRAFLASVLAQEPRILFLDEPTTALDIHHQAAFYRVVKQCCANGITVILATHELTMAAHFCDELVLLSQGTVVTQGTARDVLQQRLLQQVYGSHVNVVYPDKTGTPVIVPAFE
jgi:iron complex transport system ATP-binding protein